jgi:hypothetical protein
MESVNKERALLNLLPGSVQWKKVANRLREECRISRGSIGECTVLNGKADKESVGNNAWC